MAGVYVVRVALLLGYFQQALENCSTGLIWGLWKVERCEDKKEVNFHVLGILIRCFFKSFFI